MTMKGTTLQLSRLGYIYIFEYVQRDLNTLLYLSPFPLSRDKGYIPALTVFCSWRVYLWFIPTVFFFLFENDSRNDAIPCLHANSK